MVTTMNQHVYWPGVALSKRIELAISLIIQMDLLSMTNYPANLFVSAPKPPHYPAHPCGPPD